MSNSLIPYSFTPGTKAKAQEVNANFIALSEKIEENRAYTTSQIADTIEKLEQAGNDTDIKKADINLENTKLVSNCILDAPNGVVTVSDNVITVKKGLKVMIPDGFYDDGTTKSITYELADDVNVTTVSNAYINCIYVTPDGCNCAQRYSASEEAPKDERGIWYSSKENKSYLYNSETLAWDPINAVVVALYENTNDIVVINEIVKPVRLLTYSDRIGIVNWMMPCYAKPVGKNWYVPNIATTNGWFYAFSTAQLDAWNYVVINGVSYKLNWVRYGDQASSCIMVPLKRGDKYSMSGNYLNCGLYFIPMEGEE